MCLLLIGINSNPSFKLIIAANRDEFYDRPTLPAHYWDSNPSILAGKDLKAGGTWLGITTSGKFAALTNFREGLKQKNNAPSRGLLTLNFLNNELPASVYINSVQKQSDEYDGFNLILGNAQALYYLSNKQNDIEKLEDGIYGLSNGLLNSNWPKVVESKDKFRNAIKNTLTTDELFEILYDQSLPDENLLPDTGIDFKIERILSSIFIKTDKYGTRCSTVITVDRSDNVQFIERTFNPNDDGFSEVIFGFSITDN